MTTPILQAGEGSNNGRSRIMAATTRQIENLARCAANKPPGSLIRRNQK